MSTKKASTATKAKAEQVEAPKPVLTDEMIEMVAAVKDYAMSSSVKYNSGWALIEGYTDEEIAAVIGSRVKSPKGAINKFWHSVVKFEYDPQNADLQAAIAAEKAEKAAIKSEIAKRKAAKAQPVDPGTAEWPEEFGQTAAA